MRRAVLLVGWSRSEPVLTGAWTVRISPAELSTTAVGSGSVLVLGDAAIDTLDPRRLRERLHGERVAIVLCPDRLPARALARWMEHDFSDIVLPEELHCRLEDLCMAGVRPAVPQEAWVHVDPPPQSLALRALAVVPRLNQPFSVSEWVETLGWPRTKLRRVCVEELGASPRAVLWSYVQAVVAAGRKQGMTAERLATLLGYSEPSALSHAFTKRGARVPGGPRVRLSS